jgi:uncharacterized protein YbaA (DUF1428 family)
MLKINHSSGFFSCCTVRLEAILGYFNEHKKVPDGVDSSNQFHHYKPSTSNADITHTFFENKYLNIPYESDVRVTSTNLEQQFSNYNLLNYKQLKPFVDTYFSVTPLIDETIKKFEDKYHIDPENTCVLFYRGLAKYWETNLATYDDYIKKAEEIRAKHPTMTLLLQSDETEFYMAMKAKFDNVIIFDEARHISKVHADAIPDVERSLTQDARVEHSVNFLAIVKIMSKCKYVVTYSGNSALWICLFRNNFNGVIQYLAPKEYIYGVKSLTYDPSQTNFWICNKVLSEE